MSKLFYNSGDAHMDQDIEEDIHVNPHEDRTNEAKRIKKSSLFDSLNHTGSNLSSSTANTAGLLEKIDSLLHKFNTDLLQTYYADMEKLRHIEIMVEKYREHIVSQTPPQNINFKFTKHNYPQGFTDVDDDYQSSLNHLKTFQDSVSRDRFTIYEKNLKRSVDNFLLKYDDKEVEQHYTDMLKIHVDNVNIDQTKLSDKASFYLTDFIQKRTNLKQKFTDKIHNEPPPNTKANVDLSTTAITLEDDNQVNEVSKLKNELVALTKQVTELTVNNKSNRNQNNNSIHHVNNNKNNNRNNNYSDNRDVNNSKYYNDNSNHYNNKPSHTNNVYNSKNDRTPWQRDRPRGRSRSADSQKSHSSNRSHYSHSADYHRYQPHNNNNNHQNNQQQQDNDTSHSQGGRGRGRGRYGGRGRGKPN